MGEQLDNKQGKEGVDEISSGPEHESVYSAKEFENHLTDKEGREALLSTLSSLRGGLESVTEEELDRLSLEDGADYEDSLRHLEKIQDALGEIPANEEEIQELYKEYDEAFVNAERILQRIGRDIVYSESGEEQVTEDEKESPEPKEPEQSTELEGQESDEWEEGIAPVEKIKRSREEVDEDGEEREKRKKGKKAKGHRKRDRENAENLPSESSDKSERSEDLTVQFESIVESLREPPETQVEETPKEPTATETIPEGVIKWAANVNKRRTALRRRYESLSKEQQVQLKAEMEEIRTSDLRKEAPALQDRAWRLELQNKMAQLEQGIKKIEQERPRTTEVVSDKEVTPAEAQVEKGSEGEKAAEAGPTSEGATLSVPPEKKKLPDNEHDLIHEGWARWDEKASSLKKESELPENESKLIHEGWSKWDENIHEDVEEAQQQGVAEKPAEEQPEVSSKTFWQTVKNAKAVEEGQRTRVEQSADAKEGAEDADYFNVELTEGADPSLEELRETAERLGHGDLLLDQDPDEKLEEEISSKTFWKWVTKAEGNKNVATEDAEANLSNVQSHEERNPEEASPFTAERINSLVEEAEVAPLDDTEESTPEATRENYWKWVKESTDPTDSSKEKMPDSKASDFEEEHIDGLKTRFEDAWDEYHDALRVYLKKRNVGKDIAESFGFRTKLSPEVTALKEKYEKARTDYTLASYGRAKRRLSTERKFDFSAAKERRAELERRYMSRLILKHVVHDAERIAQIKQEVLSEKKTGTGARLLAKWQQYPKWARYGMTAGGGFGLAVATGVLPAVGVGASALIVGRRMAGSAVIGAVSPNIAKGFSKLHERLYTRKRRKEDEQLKKATTKTNFSRTGFLRERLQSLSESHDRVARSEKRQRLTSTLGTATVASAAGAGLSSIDSLYGTSGNEPETGGKPAQKPETQTTTEGAFPEHQEGDVNGGVTEPESAASVSPEGGETFTYTLQEGGYEAKHITEDFLEKKYPELDSETRFIIADKFNATVPPEMWERMGVPYIFTDIKPGASITYTPESQEFIDNIVNDVTAEREEAYGEGTTTAPAPENQAARVSGEETESQQSEPAPDRVMITPPAAGAEEVVPTFVPPGTPPTFEPFEHEVVEGGTTWDSTEAYLERRHPYLSFDDRQEITKYFLENYLPNNPEVRDAMDLPEDLSQIKPGTPIKYPHEAQLWLYEAADRVRSGNGVTEVNSDGTFRS